MFPPREGDLPRDQLIKKTEELIIAFGGPTKVDIYFKYTCENCGTRCTLAIPNKLFEKGECEKCHHNTIIKYGGLLMAAKA